MLKSFFSGRVRTLDDKIYSFRSCDDEAKDKMRGKYLDVLKKSSLRRLCNRYSDLCRCSVLSLPTVLKNDCKKYIICKNINKGKENDYM